jgi:hypothetical protein
MLTGSWATLTNDAPAVVGTMLLLSDGTVMAQQGGTAKQWYKLTPDTSGSYANGTWSNLSSMSLERQYFATNVLPDGRVFLVGGEYSGPVGTKDWTNTGEIYDPVADTWTAITNFPQTRVGDAPSQLLPDGRVLVGYIFGTQTYIYDPGADTWTATAGNKASQSSEETWLKLPDDSVLTYQTNNNGNAERYVPATDTWVATGTVPVNLSSAAVGSELGPAFLLPDGRALFLGANNNTAYYTPSTDTWAAGPNISAGLGCDDAPGAIMPNGRIIYAADTFSPNIFTPPTRVFELDPTTNVQTEVPPPAGLGLNATAAYENRMLVLPTGQILMGNRDNSVVGIYTPDGGPDASWRPTIATIVDDGGGVFTLLGTQLNGVSQGASYGDDAEMDTNYPIVRINDGGNVYYARSHDWSSTGVATGSQIVSTLFDLPAGVNLAAAPVVTTIAPAPTEGELLNNVSVATFTDPAGPGAAGDYDATIQWGDGSITLGTVSGPDGGGVFTVRGSHTYSEESSAHHPGSNPYVLTVAVTKKTDLTIEVVANGIPSTPEAFGPTGHDDANVTVSDSAVIAAGGQALTPVEGASTGSVLVATFTDPGGPEAVSDYSADINWGDGTGTLIAAGSISLNGSTFEVRGTHTYAEESAADHPGSDPYQITITIHHEATTPQVVISTATVSDPAVIAAGGQALTPVEGASTGSVLVATFSDPGGPEVLGDYSADIDWGDGTGTQVGGGSITLNGSTFEVRGTHTYAEESAADHPGSNPYQITITIHHEATTPQVVISMATVSDPAVVAVGGFTFEAVEGVPSAVQTVATFTDPGGPEPLSDYAAMIDWGDGTSPSAGTITFSNGVYTVQGSHTYAVGLGLPDDFGNTFCDGTPPYYHKPITVSVSHEAAPLAQAVSTAKISIAPGTAHLAGGSLVVVATSGDDHVLINPVGNTGAVAVKLNSNQLGSFTLGAGGRIIVAGMSGDDDIQIAGGIRLGTVLYGGPGNDRIKGGGGQNILVGCEGDDELIGGLLADLLIGGDGADRLIGGAGNDILVAANIVDSMTLAEDVQYSHLVAALNGGPIMADDDGAVDRLTGAAGVDKFFYNFLGNMALDIVTDQAELAFDV